jgi:hypothetical protein
MSWVRIRNFNHLTLSIALRSAINQLTDFHERLLGQVTSSLPEGRNVCGALQIPGAW